MALSPEHTPSIWLRRLDRAFPLLVFGLGIFFTMNFHRGNRIHYTAWSDAEGYYLYLPAVFIYGADFQIAEQGEDGLKLITRKPTRSGKPLRNKYTSGVAILQSPFFLVTHGLTSLFAGRGAPPPDSSRFRLDVPYEKVIFDRLWSAERGYATGFSAPYSYSILFASLFYLCAGLWFLKEVLKRHFSLALSLITTSCVFLSTNLFYYGLREPGMSHVYSFALFAAFLYLLPGFLEGKSKRKAALFGLVFGLVVLTRPTNIVLGLVVLLWEVYSLSDLRMRLRSLWKNRSVGVWAAIACLLIFIPQMLYWKFSGGSWLSYSYGQESFHFFDRFRFLHVLFHYQNGLFLYTPLMFLIVAGMIGIVKKRMLSGPMMVLLFLLITYIFSSWWSWWFGGAFGHRCYVEWYVLFALPLGYLLTSWFSANRKWLIYMGAGLLCFLVYANIHMTYLYSPPWEGAEWTFDSYLQVWAKVLGMA